MKGEINMADTLIDIIAKVLLYTPTNTALSVGEIVTAINKRKMFIKEDGTDITQTEVIHSLADSLEKGGSSNLTVNIKVKLKKPQASYAIGGKRVNRRSIVEYLKLQKEYDKTSRMSDDVK